MVKDTFSLFCTYHTKDFTDTAWKSSLNFCKMWLKIIYQFQIFMYVSIKACHDYEKIMNNLWPFNLLAIFHLQIAMWINNLKT